MLVAMVVVVLEDVQENLQPLMVVLERVLQEPLEIAEDILKAVEQVTMAAVAVVLETTVVELSYCMLEVI